MRKLSGRNGNFILLFDKKQQPKGILAPVCPHCPAGIGPRVGSLEGGTVCPQSCRDDSTKSKSVFGLDQFVENTKHVGS